MADTSSPSRTAWRTVALLAVIALAPAPALHAQPAAQPPAAPKPAAGATETITVTASRLNLIGRAITASQGTVTRKEFELRPVYRVGQLLETVPGLVVTAHSGEGKANQYLIRGYNLDHGTDIANFIDDMPVNRPTNAHGQGYSDVNFFIGQLFSSMDYTKGPFFASVGDFGAVASTHAKLLDTLPTQIQASIGTLGDEEIFLAGTHHLQNGANLLGALDLAHVDGPSTPPQNYRKIAAAIRLSDGTYTNGYSLTGMYYKGQGFNTTDQPLRAIDERLIGRFGTLDPTDGNQSDRWSVSGHHGVSGDNWNFVGSIYAIHGSMVLWNDFTHLLNDPVNGDQEQQDETRTTLGGAFAYSINAHVLDMETSTTVGLQERYDTVTIDRRHTRGRMALDYCNDGFGPYSVGQHACTANRVTLDDTAPYIQNTTHWLPWLRTIVGAREEYESATDRSVLSTFPFNGHAGELVFQPKASIALGPWHSTELYYSAGRGFHSDDARGVLQSVPIQGFQLASKGAPLLAKTFGQEVGLRNALIPNLQTQIALFRQDFSSELGYNQDAGQDVATAPSRRTGVELSVQYRPFRWIELNADMSSAKARYFASARRLASQFGITGGTYISDAPRSTGSLGILVDNLGPWSGSLAQRILGSYPLTDGPTTPRAKGYSETNLQIGYKLTPKIKLQLAIYNLFNSHAYSAEYYYATNINAAEVSHYGQAGRGDYQVHPIEPPSARFILAATF